MPRFDPNVGITPATCPASFVAVPGRDYALFDYDVHTGHHHSLQVPALAFRAGQRVGDEVKLIFREYGVAPERMWVRIVAASGNGVYTGVLANDPVYMRAIKCDDMVVFTAANIVQRMKDGVPSSY